MKLRIKQRPHVQVYNVGVDPNTLLKFRTASARLDAAETELKRVTKEFQAMIKLNLDAMISAGDAIWAGVEKREGSHTVASTCHDGLTKTYSTYYSSVEAVTGFSREQLLYILKSNVGVLDIEAIPDRVVDVVIKSQGDYQAVSIDKVDESC